MKKKETGKQLHALISAYIRNPSSVQPSPSFLCHFNTLILPFIKGAQKVETEVKFATTIRSVKISGRIDIVAEFKDYINVIEVKYAKYSTKVLEGYLAQTALSAGRPGQRQAACSDSHPSAGGTGILLLPEEAGRVVRRLSGDYAGLGANVPGRLGLRLRESQSRTGV